VPALAILLVEDNEVNRLVAEGFLARHEHRVTAVGSDEAALEALDDDSFDLVLMDIRMPGMGGLEAIRRIRAGEQHNGAHVPIIALTAQVVRSEIDACFAAGADAFLGKPFEPAELDAAIARCLSLTTGAPAEIENTTKTPAVDSKVMRQHLDLLGRDYAGRIVDTFAETTPRIMATLRDDLEAGAYERVSGHAHSLKSAAGNVGLPHVADLARRLEKAAGESDTETSRRTLNALEGAYAAASSELRTTWQSLAADGPSGEI